MKKIIEKLGKFWRGLQREVLGESNKLVIPMPPSHGFMVPMAAASVPNPNNRLQFENSKVMIEGSDWDVHRVRCLDNVIGRLSEGFNAKSAARLEKHVADVAASLQKVRAYRITDDKQKIPVDQLEYTIGTYKVAAPKA